nr:hypothetical protein BaRGS_027943 [Batillaria attramentaria]
MMVSYEYCGNTNPVHSMVVTEEEQPMDIGPNGGCQRTVTFLLQDMPPTGLLGRTDVNIDYRLKLEVITNDEHFPTLNLKVPVIIGTNPAVPAGHDDPKLIDAPPSGPSALSVANGSQPSTSTSNSADFNSYGGVNASLGTGTARMARRGGAEDRSLTDVKRAWRVVLDAGFLRVTGHGDGSGGSPVTGSFIVFVDNLCPECHTGQSVERPSIHYAIGVFGSVDLGVSGDGRWHVGIQAVQCPVGNGKVEYKFQGSNPYYIKLQVRNARIPVHLLEVQVHGSWQKMSHTADGYFTYTSGPVEGNLHVRLTAVNGAQITETIPGGIRNDVVIQGSHQFPLDSSLPHA